jgi:hypothetical protein
MEHDWSAHLSRLKLKLLFTKFTKQQSSSTSKNSIVQTKTMTRFQSHEHVEAPSCPIWNHQQIHKPRLSSGRLLGRRTPEYRRRSNQLSTIWNRFTNHGCLLVDFWGENTRISPSKHPAVHYMELSTDSRTTVVFWSTSGEKNTRISQLKTDKRQIPQTQNDIEDLSHSVKCGVSEETRETTRD